MNNKKGPSRGPWNFGDDMHRECLGRPNDSTSICAAVAVSLCLDELERLKATECLPTPELLMERLRSRTADFILLAGVAGAYLKGLGATPGSSGTVGEL
jgi:hypothetical protein